jgi:hypothetical protein
MKVEVTRIDGIKLIIGRTYMNNKMFSQLKHIYPAWVSYRCYDDKDVRAVK